MYGKTPGWNGQFYIVPEYVLYSETPDGYVKKLGQKLNGKGFCNIGRHGAEIVC